MKSRPVDHGLVDTIVIPEMMKASLMLLSPVFKKVIRLSFPKSFPHTNPMPPLLS